MANVNAIFEEIKRTNWQDPGTWHWAPKILVLLIVLIGIPVVGFFTDTQGQIEHLEAGRAEQEKLKQEYLNKKRQAVNLDLHRQQLAEIDRQFGALLKQLPNRAEMDSLLQDINQAGLGRGLQFELFKPGADAVKEFYAEMPIDIRVTGGYHELGEFASDVARMPRIVTLNNIAMEADKDGRLKLEAKAVTYRYLDEEEMAQQRQAAKAAKAAKEKK